MGKVAENLTGQTYNRLTALRRVAVRGKFYWLCRCTCGNDTYTDTTKLKSGAVKSCGCKRKESARRVVHGGAKRGEHSGAYKTWCSLKQRCLNPRNRDYKNYGARGITVCEHWLKFENFLADMGERPSGKHTIERKNNDRGYNPKNCEWMLRAGQNNNRRNSLHITAFGETRTLADWARHTGINYTTIQMRIYKGMDPEKAMTPIER